MDSQFFCEGSAEVQCETGVSVADDLFRKSEPLEYVVKVQLCDLGACDGCCAG
jgi:hypothetical protein